MPNHPIQHARRKLADVPHAILKLDFVAFSNAQDTCLVSPSFQQELALVQYTH